MYQVKLRGGGKGGPNNEYDDDDNDDDDNNGALAPEGFSLKAHKRPTIGRTVHRNTGTRSLVSFAADRVNPGYRRAT